MNVQYENEQLVYAVLQVSTDNLMFLFCSTVGYVCMVC